MARATDTKLQNLIDLASSGDDTARDALLDHACERLTMLPRKMLRGYPQLRRWEQTDDVCQNAMLRLHRALEKVEVESVRHFFNLAATQIRRELLDLAKHHFGPHGGAANHHTDGQPADDEGGSVNRASQEPTSLEGWTEFHAQIELLPDEEQEVFNLIWYDGLTQPEVAHALDVSLRTVKRRWQSARLRLSESLKEQLD